MRLARQGVAFPCCNSVIRVLFVVWSLSCFSAQWLSAQADFEKGYQAYQTYHGSDFDRVNLANGNLILNIPLLSYEQRGGLPPIVIAIRSNSTTFQSAPPFSSGPPDTQQSEVPSGVVGSPWGQPHVMISPGGLWWREIRETVNGVQYARFEAVDDSGAVHSLAGNIANQLQGSLGNVRYSIDGSDYLLTAAASPLIIDRKGNTGGLADPNGNAIKLNGLCAKPVGSGLSYDPSLANWQGYAYGSASATSIVDSVGRTIPNPAYLAPYGSGCVIDTDTSYYPSTTSNSASCPALEPGASGAVSETYQFPAAKSTTIPLTFCYQQISIHASLPNVSNGTTTINETWPVLTAAILPNGTSWVVTYDSWGQVATVTTPTGATLSYTYGTGSHPTRLTCGLPPGEIPLQGTPTWPVNNLMSSRPVSKRTMTITNPGGSTQTELWSYASTIGSGWQNSPNSGTVTVTDGMGNDTAHTFSLIGNTTTGQPVCGPYETQTKYYQGTKSSGTLLKQVSATYTSIGTDQANPLNFTNYIAIGVFPSSETTTLPVGGGTSSQVKQETETYDQFGTYQDFTGTTYGFSFGQKLADTESDFGAGKAGAVVRTNQYANQWESTYNIYAKNLVDLPCLETTYSGAQSGTLTSCTPVGVTSNQASQTQYFYDEAAYVPSGKIGLPSTVTRWLKNGSSPSSHTAYNTQAMPTIQYDPNSNQTLIAYDASGLYPNKITHPLTGSTAHVETPSYDDATGELLSHKDENQNPTSYQYDSMRRLTTTTYADGGTETFQFTDATPPSYTFTKVLNSSASTYTEVGLADTLGRKTQTQITSDVKTLFADTTYDNLGRVASQSNPYYVNTETTYGVTTFTYDAIGRKVIQNNPDSSAQQWCFENLATNGQTNCHAQLAKTGTSAAVGSFADFKDESGNDWQRNSDGLDRLTSVMEPNGAAAVPSMQTTYAYDVLGSLLTVAQAGNGTDAPPTQRQFTYDTLSRLSTAFNPESGTASYTYDANGNVLTHTQPLVNQASGTQKLNYCYDALNRKVYEYIGSLISNCITTPPATANLLSAYSYDTSGVSGTANAIGHMTDALEYTAGTAVWERSPFKYDTMGRLLSEQQCAFGSCTKPYPFAYTYDYAGNVLSTSNGLTAASPITVGYTYDHVARLSTVTSATPTTGIWAGTGFPSTLYTAKSYGPAGLVSATYGTAGGTLSRTYDNRLRVTDSKIATSATLYHYGLTYASNSNISTVTDSVIGNWTYTYDTLNRLASATASTAGVVTPWGTYKTQCWIYDSFGNRTGEGEMTAATACPNPITGANHSVWAKYNTSNQLTSNSIVPNFLYDDAGNTTNDGTNKYVYDLDGRICAVTPVVGGTFTQYVYDAEGRRVAKGTLTTFPIAGSACSAPTAANGFSLTGTGAAIYLRGAHGDQDTELDGTGVWRHTNVFAGGGLTATYDTGTKATLSFNYSDWLGSKRVQSAFGGAVQNSWASDPYGAYLKALGTGADATEHHFTGKERDGESGNDYFGARYYASGVGRWMNPDWSVKAEPVPYAKLDGPQSLNLYSYVTNDPNSVADLDGHVGPGTEVEDALREYAIAHPEVVAAFLARTARASAAVRIFTAGAVLRVSAGAAAFVGLAAVFPTALPGGTASTDWPKDPAGHYVRLDGTPEKVEDPAPLPKASSGGARQGGGGRRTVDFSGSTDLRQDLLPGQLNTVRITYTGSRRQDYAAANKAAGYGTTQKPPTGYTWHHVADYDVKTNTGTMQLVRTDAHQSSLPHDGGVKQYEQATGETYK